MTDQAQTLRDAEAQSRYAARFLDAEVEDATATIEKFKANLAINPANAFSWAEEAIKAAARLDVAVRLRAVFEAHGFDAAMNDALVMTLEGARNPKHSTSAVSNLVAEATTAAFAVFASRYKEVR